MTKTEALNEYQSCVERYRKLLERIYKIKNYSSDEECKRLVSLIQDKIKFNSDEYKIATVCSESAFQREKYTNHFDRENSIINSCSSAIDRLEALLGINSNAQERYY